MAPSNRVVEVSSTTQPFAAETDWVIHAKEAPVRLGLVWWGVFGDECELDHRRRGMSTGQDSQFLTLSGT